MSSKKRKALPIRAPKFRSEAEEARWWDAHPEAATELLERGAALGTLTRGQGARRLATHATTIRLFVDDVERARKLAHDKGLPYQTYLKMLLREALRREEKAS